jgi:hypothetical protein
VLFVSFHAGVMGPILDLANRSLEFALHLLGNSFHLKARIAEPLARFLLRASCHLIERTVQSICIHLSTSVDTTVMVSKDALEINSSALTVPRSASRPKMHAAELVCSAAWCCAAHLLVGVAAVMR